MASTKLSAPSGERSPNSFTTRRHASRWRKLVAETTPTVASQRRHSHDKPSKRKSSCFCDCNAFVTGQFRTRQAADKTPVGRSGGVGNAQRTLCVGCGRPPEAGSVVRLVCAAGIRTEDTISRRAILNSTRKRLPNQMIRFRNDLDETLPTLPFGTVAVFSAETLSF